jgi:pimeloyl-ACP methyl ester carboxylesterase
MALQWLARESTQKVFALVAVGLPIDANGQDGGLLDALHRVKLPVLDIYGSRDATAAAQSTRKRMASALKAGNKDFRQIEIAGADHDFRGQQDILLSRVRSWLVRLISEQDSL